MDISLKTAEKHYSAYQDRLSASNYWKEFCRCNPGCSLFISDLNHYDSALKLKELKKTATQDYSRANLERSVTKFIQSISKSHAGQDIDALHGGFYQWNSEKNIHEHVKHPNFNDQSLSIEVRKPMFLNWHMRLKNATKIDHCSANYLIIWVRQSSNSFRVITEFWQSKADGYTWESTWDD